MAENKKSNQADAYMESMKAYQKTYDFLLYLYPILSQFPKFEKFALQSQIKTAVFEMLKSVIRFRKTGTRYMDDFIILSDDLEQLKEWVKRIEEFLENEMLLHINPKSTILYAGNGIDFADISTMQTTRK